ncbi:MAG: hypothetical protein ACFFAJ_13525 [Candidatus Hodarchaeota archaeon]
MSGEYEARGLIATRPTLKWFIVIGIVIVIIGILIYEILFPFIGFILFWLGFAIISLSLITLLFLWLSDRILPKPKY